MNHIHKLTANLDTTTKALEAERAMLLELRLYLLSPKFQGADPDDQRVNVQDVLLRLDEAQAAGNDHLAQLV